MPMISPLLMCKSMWERALRVAFLEYLKLTWSKSMEPSFTSITGFWGFCRVLSSESTSTIRSADSKDMVTITNIMETIIRLIKIWKE